LDAANQTSMLETLDALRREVARLSDRVAAVEAIVGNQPPTEAKDGSPSAVQRLDEDVVSAITAAIAAYLGVKPHIRQINLIGGTFWAQHGRVTIQASHSFAIRHD
jgi:methylmalonyl-CoA carboxyltransferase large subunit